MNHSYYKKLFGLIIFLLFNILSAQEDNGLLYKLNEKTNSGNLKGLAAKIANRDTIFRYEPGSRKKGILNDLTLQTYAVSPDNTVLALAESIPSDNGNFINRIIFMDYDKFLIINGIEFKETHKITEIFFFFDKLVCLMEGKTSTLKALKLSPALAWYHTKLPLKYPVSSICFDNEFFYVKDKNLNIMQIDDALQQNSLLTARRKGGVLFTVPDSDKIVNFTKNSIEIMRKTSDGLFKSTFRDLKNTPEPVAAWVSDVSAKSVYFTAADGSFHELVDFSYSEEKENVSDFQMIFFHPEKKEFFLLANKKNIIEIVTPPELNVRRKVFHHTMRPRTHQNIKFIIPHKDGLFLITQQKEFVFIKEHKKRFFKEKIQ